MKETKNNNNKIVYTRIILLIVISLFIIASIAVVATFAWFKDFFEDDGPTLSTGKINATLTEYKFVNDEWITPNDPLYDSENSPSQDSALKNSTNSSFAFDLSETQTDTIYYVVHKKDDSIDLDVSLSFILKGLEESALSEGIEYAGGFFYQLSEVTFDESTINNETPDAEKASLQSILSNDLNQEPDAVEKALYGINEDVAKSTLTDSEYAIFRLTCSYVNADSDAGTANAYLDKEFYFRVNFSVGQVGSLDGTFVGTTHYVSSEYDLRTALNEYQTGDSIYLNEDIIFTNDLIIDHPVKFYVRGKTLTVRGNINISYADTGDFLIDTQNGGKIIVARIGQSGNFIVDLPNAMLEILGSGNNAPGYGDIYVSNKFSALSSYSRGLYINRANIYNTITADVNDQTTVYQDIYIGESSYIMVGQKTAVGTLLAGDGVSLTYIANYGTIDTIDLSSMSLNPDNPVPNDPQILVENYGTINRVILDAYSIPCYIKGVEHRHGANNEYYGNTRLINKLSGELLEENVSGADLIHVETDTNSVYVEPTYDDEDYKRITVHYSNRFDFDGLEITDTSLADVLEWYFNTENCINPDLELKKVTEMKVICYGNKTLTDADYQTINGMTELISLDLSESRSAESKIKTGAFESLANLTTIQLPEDNSIEEYAFRGTRVEELSVPASYASFHDLAFDSTANVVQIKYLHLQGFSEYENVAPASQYIFVANEDLLSAYKATHSRYPHKIFLEAERVGDYFVRYVGDADCEIATYVGSAFDYTVETSPIDVNNNRYSLFNFSTFTATDGKTYKVTSFDDYAFYNKLTSGTPFDLTIENAHTIGAYAFYGATKIQSITLFSQSLTVGNYAFAVTNNIATVVESIDVTSDSVTIGEYAFYYIKSAESVEITSNTVTIGNYAFSDCSNIQRLIIDGAGTIGNSAFANNSNLLEVVAPKITKIGLASFYNNNKLLAVVMPSLVDIGVNPLNGSSSSSGTSAFGKCTKLKYVETSVITKINGVERVSNLGGSDGNKAVSGTSAYYNHYVVFESSAKIEVFVINTENLSSPNFQNIPNLFAQYSYPHDMNLIVPYDYQNVYNQTSFGGRFNIYTYKYVIPNTEYQGDVRFMREVDGKWVDSEPYVINYETGAIDIAQYAYHELEDNSLQILCNTKKSITQGSLIVPDSVWINDSKRLISSVGPYAFRTAYVNVDTLSFGENITSLRENALGKWNNNAEYGPGYDTQGVDKRTIASTVDMGNISDLIGFKSDTTFLISNVSNFKGNLSSLDSRIFSGVTNLKGVEFPNVTTLSSQEFYGCTGLVTASFASLESISGSAFEGCTALTTVNMPKVTSITDSAFANTGLTAITDTTFPKLETIGDYAFSGCELLHTVSLDKVTSLGDYAFQGCTTPFTVSLNSLVTLNPLSFQGNTSLTEINCPKVSELNNAEFAGCTALKSATFGTSLTSVSGGAFEGCSALTFVSMPSVTSVTDRAFKNTGFTELTDVMFPKLQTIGGDSTRLGGAFYGCSKLVSINLSSVVTITNSAFNNCRPTGTITATFANLNTVTNYAFGENDDVTGTDYAKIKSFSAPELVTVGVGAFYKVSTLTSISVPKMQTISGDSAFRGIQVESFDAPGLTSITGTQVFIYSGIKHFTANNLTEMSEANNFMGCSSLQSFNAIILTGKIGTTTFASCTSLQTFNAPNVTSIGQSAFKGCTALQTFDGPNVTSISQESFSGCTSLKKVSFPSVTQFSARQSFYNCSNLTSAYFPNLESVHHTSARTETFYNTGFKVITDDKSRWDNGEEVFYAPELNTIAQKAFMNCKALQTISLSSLQYIKGEAFKGCTSLESVYLPNLEEIQKSSNDSMYNSFENCSKLTWIYMPSLTEIEGTTSNVFAGCTNLKVVHFGQLNSVTASGLGGFGSVVNIFADGEATNEISLPMPIVVKGENADYYIAEGWSRAEVENLELQLLFVDVNGKAITYSELFNANGDVKVPVAFYKKTLNTAGDLTLMNAVEIVLDENNNYTIPTSITVSNETFPVVEIASYAFKGVGATSMSTLSFGDNIKRVGDNIFSSEAIIEKLDLNNVQSLGALPISTLCSVYGEDLIELTGEGTFANCSLLSNVYLPSLTEIPASTFSGCSNLSILEASEVTTIGAGALAGCSSLTTLVFPELITLGGDSTTAIFENCENLTQISFGKNFASMTGKIFEGCNSLQLILIQNDTSVVTFEGDGSALMIPSRATLLVPGRVLPNYQEAWGEVPTYSADGEQGTLKIESYQTSQEIDGITYYLDKVTDDGTELTISFMVSNAFLMPDTLTSLTLISEGTYINHVVNGTEVTETEVTGKVVAISERAMQIIGQLTSLETLSLPTYLKYFEYKDSLPASLKAYVIDNTNSVTYSVVDGVLYSKDGSVVISYPSAKAVEGTLTLGADVKIISEYAFYGNENITSIVIEGSVVINDSAFENCSGLNSITFTSTTPSVFVGSDIINGCHEDLQIFVPAGSLDNYKTYVFVDDTVASKFVEAQISA